MEMLGAIIKAIMSLGPVVMMPIVIFLFGLVMGQGAGRAFRSGVTVGVGFVGIFMTLGLLMGAIGPAAQQMVQNWGLSLNVIDIGWPAASAISWGWGLAYTVMIPVVFVVNLLMLATRLTATFDVDIWNYWHFATTGAIIGVATGNPWLGLAGAVIAAIITFKLADWTAPMLTNFYELPQVSTPHLTAVGFVPLVALMDRVVDAIPGLRDIKADPEATQRRFGVFGEPVIMGLILGLILGLLAYGLNLAKILPLGVNMGAVMLILPRMVKILMEGLVPLSEAAREFTQKRFAGRDIYIGLDWAILAGHPTVIATALILIPITILLAIVLIPLGNRTLPFADLAAIAPMICLGVAYCRGNLIRSVLYGTVIMGIDILIATKVAPMFTELGQQVASVSGALADALSKLGGAASGVQMSAIEQGGAPTSWLVQNIFRLNQLGTVELVMTIVWAIILVFGSIELIRVMKGRKDWGASLGKTLGM